MFLMFQLQSRAQPAISTLSTCSKKIIICFPKSTYNLKTISCALNLCNTFLPKVCIYFENHKLWVENTRSIVISPSKTFRFLYFFGLAYQGKDIVFRFILEYSSRRDFGPLVIIGLLLYEDFWKMIFWLVLKLEISYRVIISWRILVCFRAFFEDYIFAWSNSWVSIILLLAFRYF